MKHKVGDKVKIRKDLDVDKIYGYDAFVENMKAYLGKWVTIAKESDSHVKYHIEEDGERWFWTDEMFEENTNAPKFNVGDKVRLRKDLEVGKEYNGIILREEMYHRHYHDIMTIKYGDDDQYTCKENGYWWGEDMFEDDVVESDYAESKRVDIGYYLEHCGHRVIENVYYYYDDSRDHVFCVTAGCTNQYRLPVKAINFIIPHED